MLTYDLTARGRKTMYEYLYEAMKADILSGRLAADCVALLGGAGKILLAFFDSFGDRESGSRPQHLV